MAEQEAQCDVTWEAGRVRFTNALTEFLLARLEDDRNLAEYGCEGQGEYSTCGHLSQRFKADWNAKRRIAKYYHEAVAEGYDTSQAEDAACAIATTWAHHPDFHESWRL